MLGGLVEPGVLAKGLSGTARSILNQAGRDGGKGITSNFSISPLSSLCCPLAGLNQRQKAKCQGGAVLRAAFLGQGSGKERECTQVRGWRMTGTSNTLQSFCCPSLLVALTALHKSSLIIKTKLT